MYYVLFVVMSGMNRTSPGISGRTDGQHEFREERIQSFTTKHLTIRPSLDKDGNGELTLNKISEGLYSGKSISAQ